MSCLCDLRMFVNDRAAIERSEQPLVRVDRYAVGPLYTVENMPDRRRCQRSATIRRIDVKPDILFLTHIRDPCEIIDDAGVCRSRCGDHGKKTLTSLWVEACDLGSEFVTLETLFGRNKDHVGIDDTSHRLYRRVSTLGRYEQSASEPVRAVACSPLFPRCDDRRQICFGSTRSKNAERSGRHSR